MSTKSPRGELCPATDLRRRMIEDLQLAGMSERTQSRKAGYVRTVRQLAEYYQKPPDQITDEELRQYFLHLKTNTTWASSVTLYGIKFFKVRLPRYRICLQTIYSCGLRLREGTELQVGHIDSRRMVIHLHHGKGNKDRYVPLPQNTLERLREY